MYNTQVDGGFACLSHIYRDMASATTGQETKVAVKYPRTYDAQVSCEGNRELVRMKEKNNRDAILRPLFRCEVCSRRIRRNQHDRRSQPVNHPFPFHQCASK